MIEQTQLARGGPVVSRLALGTAYFGTRIAGAAARRMLELYMDEGGNFIDTADIYGRDVLKPGVADAGASERELGKLLRGRRDRVVLATKVGQRALPGSGDDKVGLSQSGIRRAIDASLMRLRTDWVDIYQAHLWDPYVPVEETLGTLTDLVSEGKVRWIGVSNWDGWQVARAAIMATYEGWAPIVSNQVWYNAVDRQIEDSVLEACRASSVGVIAWGALAQGFLMGHYQPQDGQPRTGRFSGPGQLPVFSWQALATPQGWAVLEAAQRTALEAGVATSVVALRWLLDEGAADVALIGPRDESQLAELVIAGTSVVPREGLFELTRLGARQHSYPRAFTDAYSVRESPVYGGLANLGSGDAGV